MNRLLHLHQAFMGEGRKPPFSQPYSQVMQLFPGEANLVTFDVNMHKVFQVNCKPRGWKHPVKSECQIYSFLFKKMYLKMTSHYQGKIWVVPLVHIGHEKKIVQQDEDGGYVVSMVLARIRKIRRKGKEEADGNYNVDDGEDTNNNKGEFKFLEF